MNENSPFLHLQLILQNWTGVNKFPEAPIPKWRLPRLCCQINTGEGEEATLDDGDAPLGASFPDTQ